MAVIDTYFGFQFGIYENAPLPHTPKTKLGIFLNTSFLIAHDKYTIRVLFFIFFSDEFLIVLAQNYASIAKLHQQN